MFMNFWWPLEFSSAVTAKPKRITALCQQFAIYRTPDGKAVVMSDLCVHRGGSRLARSAQSVRIARFDTRLWHVGKVPPQEILRCS